METVRSFLKRLKIGLLYHPAIPLLGVYLKIKLQCYLQKPTIGSNLSTHGTKYLSRDEWIKMQLICVQWCITQP